MLPPPPWLPPESPVPTSEFQPTLKKSIGKLEELLTHILPLETPAFCKDKSRLQREETEYNEVNDDQPGTATFIFITDVGAHSHCIS